jgi:hypothetical protein
MYIESFLGNPVNLGDGGKVDTNSDDSYAILVFREGRITHKITVSLKSSGSASGDAIEYAEIADAKG